jgi:hypothetical protein
MKKVLLTAVAVASLPCAAFAQSMGDDTATQAAPVAAAPQVTPVAVAANGAVTLPADTLIVVTPLQEITSKKMKEGETRTLQVANDVVEKGRVIIPRGSPVEALVTWRTGKGIGGKSAKFEITFQKVTIGSRTFALKGKHRQEGRGNTVAALLGSMLISGRSAVMTSGQLVNAFTAEPITVE